jgi:hypothetical protein
MSPTMTTDRLAQALADLERATAARRAASEVWARSRDLLDLGPFFDALAEERKAADFYYFCRGLMPCLKSFTTSMFAASPIIRTWTKDLTNGSKSVAAF